MRYIPGVIKGPRHRLRIDDLDEEGAGVGVVGDLELHVPFALPGETVEAELEHRSPHRAAGSRARSVGWGRLREVLEPSPDRVPVACAAWGRCGGCVLQHLRYERQLEWKRDLVAGPIVAAGIEAPVGACVASPRVLGYRDKSKLVFARRGEELILGAYAPRSHRVVDLAGCAVVEPPLDAVARTIAVEAGRLGLEPYDEASGRGEARYAVARRSADGRVHVLLVRARAAHDPGCEPFVELARRIRHAHPEVAGVVANLQPAAGNVLVGAVAPDRVLDGEAFLEERVGPVRLRLSPRAFFQANRELAALIYADVAARAEAAGLGAGGRAIDVYSGVGGIALLLGRSGATAIGIEDNPAAVEDARAAAALQNLTNVRFISGDAARLLADRALVGERADVVVLNPPRRGCSPVVLAAAAALAARALLYVSCSPRSLGRDLAVLAGLGYAVRRVTPYDMLPHTPHVEALAELGPRL
jgi:23S rRNA (uracil1939-C5)-methyltransferase